MLPVSAFGTNGINRPILQFSCTDLAMDDSARFQLSVAFSNTPTVTNKASITVTRSLAPLRLTVNGGERVFPVLAPLKISATAEDDENVDPSQRFFFFFVCVSLSLIPVSAVAILFVLFIYGLASYTISMF